MQALSARTALDSLRRMGPYLLIELLLPGGTLFAVLLWLYNGGARGQLTNVEQAAPKPAFVERLVKIATRQG